MIVLTAGKTSECSIDPFQARIQNLHNLLFDLFRNAISGFCDAAGDRRKRIAVSPQRNGVSQRVFKIVAFTESNKNSIGKQHKN